MTRRRFNPSLILTFGLFAGCLGAEDELSIGASVSGLVFNPSIGGPNNQTTQLTYACTNNPVTFQEFCMFQGTPVAHVNTAAAAQVYMDAAAFNWGCKFTSNTNPVVQITDEWGGWVRNFKRSYGRSAANTTDCGVAWWNGEKQAAYFTPVSNSMGTSANTTPSGGTNNTHYNIYMKYLALGLETSALGMPIANPVGYGWNSVTYQQFKYGIITVRNTGAGYYASSRETGTGPIISARQAVLDRYYQTFGISPGTVTGQGVVATYGLLQDMGYACGVAGQPACNAMDSAGIYLKFFDTYWGGTTGYVIARNGWTSAFLVDGPLGTVWDNNFQPPIYSGGMPWAGSTFGFPIEQRKVIGTATNGQPIEAQQFETGFILWQPKTCTTAQSCPAAGPSHCTTYGTLINGTNYVATAGDPGAPISDRTPLVPGIDVCSPPSVSQMPCVTTPWSNATPWDHMITASPTAYPNLSSRMICAESGFGFPAGIEFRWGNTPGIPNWTFATIKGEYYEKWLASGNGSISDAAFSSNGYGLPYNSPTGLSHGGLSGADSTLVGMRFQRFADPNSLVFKITMHTERPINPGPETVVIGGQIAKSTTSGRHTWTLSNPLDNSGAQDGCNTADRDEDCLNDGMETMLGYLLAPRLYYDDEETSAFGQHYQALQMIQVRPWTVLTPDNSQSTVSTWATSGVTKWIVVRLSLAFPFQDAIATWDHVGDSEMVELQLFSTDPERRTWQMHGIVFTHHYFSHFMEAGWLKSIADRINSSDLIIAVEQNTHGSWDGGLQDDFPGCSNYVDWHQRDCWDDDEHFFEAQQTLEGATVGGHYYYFNPARNVGEPKLSSVDPDDHHFTSAGWPDDGPTSPRIAPVPVELGGDGVMPGIWNDTGHGFNAEMLVNPLNNPNIYGGIFGGFCGWKCPFNTNPALNQRDHWDPASALDCASPPHGVIEVCDRGCYMFSPHNSEYDGITSPFEGSDFCYSMAGVWNRRSFTK